MIAKLPLDSPLWGELSACYSRQNAIARLREVMETRELGEGWKSLLDEILHQGTVYGVTSAAIPHLVDLAPDLPAASRCELWIEVGLLVTAGAGRFPSPPPAEGLQEGLTAALEAAEILAVRDFLAGDGSVPEDDCYFALTCVALAGHPVGRAFWKFPSPSSGYMRMDCPGCQAECDVDGFADPVALPCPVPRFGAARSVAGPWRDVAEALERARLDQVLGPGWGGFLGTARQVALAGVPADAPPKRRLVPGRRHGRDQVTRIGAMGATLARLTGHVRCLDCSRVWAIADALDDRSGAQPVDAPDARLPDGYVQDALFPAGERAGVDGQETGGVWPEAVADAVAGFRPAPGRVLPDAGLSARLLWSARQGPVSALTLVAGHKMPVIAAVGDTGITLRHADSGAEAGSQLAGRVGPVASLVLPDGTPVIAAAGAGGLSWLDAATGRELNGEPAQSAAPVLSLAPVVMPASPKRAYEPLARLAGRTVLAAGDADGVVRLWDPVDRAPLPPLFQRPGRRVVSLTPADFVNQPPWEGTDLVALYGDLLVDVWASATVHGKPSTMAPRTGRLAAAGHQHVTAAAVSPRRIGHRRPVLLADRNGTVSMWETFGVRLSDPLPPDPAHREVNAIAVLPGPGDGITVVTASHADSSLRAWQPANGTSTLIPADARPRCLLAIGEILIIGDDDGLLALSLTGETR